MAVHGTGSDEPAHASTGGDAVPFEHILYENRSGVAHVTLNRPDRLNVLGVGPGSNRDEISRALTNADADDDIGCVLIAANGRAFCAGGDLLGGGGTTPLDHHLFGEAIVRFYAGIRGMHKPVIAAVNGLCLGAGMGFVAHCDFTFAGDDAEFGLIEGRIGHPGAADLVSKIGAAWAKFLILTGETIDAERAQEIGLVLAVLPRDELIERVTDLAERLARMPREAVLLNKACIDDVADAMGGASGRLVGRAHDTVTKSMADDARAPDGRRFADILRGEGMEGLKRARSTQYKTPWLPPRSKP